MDPLREYLQLETRRQFFGKTAMGLGAAALAGLAVDFWSDRQQLDSARGSHQRFEPRIAEAEREELYAGWLRAVERSRDWVRE